MPTAAGQTTTNRALNYLGALNLFKRRPNSVLQMIGALNEDGTMTVGNGWRETPQYEFSTTVDYDLPPPSQPARLEGAAAPAADTNQPSQAKNTVQLFTEAVDVSYLKESSRLRISGIAVDDEPNNPSGLAYQIQRKLEKIAQDANFSFLNGVYNLPADPAAAALATRGIRTCITTNAFGNGAVNRPISAAIIQNAYKAMIDNAGVQPDQLLALVNTSQMAAISTLYANQFNNNQNLSSVAGVQVRQVLTAFGILNLVLELDVLQTEMIFVNPSVIQGVSLPHPEKGNLFFEELARTGSSFKGQLYGQMGIDHGPEWAHARIFDLTP
jgi:hypothetical protein